MSSENFYNKTDELYSKSKIRKSEQIGPVFYVYTFDCPDGDKAFVRYSPDFTHKTLTSLRIDFGKYGSGYQYFYNDPFKNEEEEKNILAVLTMYKDKYGEPSEATVQQPYYGDSKEIKVYRWTKSEFIIDFYPGEKRYTDAGSKNIGAYIKYEVSDGQKEEINHNKSRESSTDI